jgi:hypothetical protein
MFKKYNLIGVATVIAPHQGRFGLHMVFYML